MNDHEQLARANQVIADFDAGAYDQQLGVTEAERATLNRARAEGRLTLDDFRTLVRLGEYDLADQAHTDDRIDY